MDKKDAIENKVAVFASRPMICYAVPLSILPGDAIEQLQQLQDESVNCVITSPPYFGLRDYGKSGQIGLEPTFAEYKEKLVAVFSEVRRVLRSDGTLWLNLGDSYAGSGKGSGEQAGIKQQTNRAWRTFDPTKSRLDSSTRLFGNRNGVGFCDGFKPKDLMLVPARIAIALQESGWYLRNEIIWHKTNVMPESVKDRLTKAHEQIFLLTKSPHYYFNQNAVRESAQTNTKRTFTGNGLRADQRKAMHINQRAGTHKKGKNKRTVWTLPTKPHKSAHFAVFPEALIEPCVLAGCPPDGIILDPFAGSGTTGVVALKYGRRAILIELNETYIEIIKERCSNLQLKLLA